MKPDPIRIRPVSIDIMLTKLEEVKRHLHQIEHKHGLSKDNDLSENVEETIDELWEHITLLGNSLA
jgi:hypothetical protein